MLAVGLVLPALSAPGAASAATARPPVQPLPSNLEQLRAQEAQQLYGSPDIRPIEQRKTALITLGDSQISGEGVGNYEEGTHQNGNWCDRSRDQAVWRLGIAADVRYNVACSGAEPAHLVFGGPHQWNERNQGDNLAIKARNTRVKLVWIVVGANGEGTIQFGPVATDCVKRRIFFLGPCYGTYSDGWAARVDGSRRAVEQAVTSVKQTMTDAGYLTEDYELALMSYPSPGGPDVEDNPNFPGWYRGGCLIYLHDAAFARNKAVPLFERGIRAAAANTGVRYLDASRLFHGHGVCDDNPWVRGVYIENGNIFDENAARQSLHPNYLGHGAFARCMTDFYNSGWSTATCFDPASTRTTTLVNGLLEFRQLRNLGSGGCADGEGYNSRNGTQLLAWTCHGGRNQGFWYDPGRRSLHVELSQDRCVDAEGGVIAPGTRAILWDCHGLANQAWVFDGTAIHPAGSASLCLAFDATGNGARLRLAPCNGSAIQQWAFESRDYANPVGYNHADFIGSRVY
jgi:hypothetical protein